MTGSDALGLDYAPWRWSEAATGEQRAAMAERLAELRGRGHDIGADCTVSALAVVDADRLVLGRRSYVAAHAHLTGDLELGADCSVNVGVAVRGRVRMGDGVRIGAGTSVLGFEHVFDDPDLPVFRQPLSSAGVVLGDDVWLGTRVVVLDGVRVGSHAVVGAGAVVTRDVPDWAIVVGNPARVVGDRRERGARRGLRRRLADHADAARAEVPGILARAWDGAFRDTADAAPTVRAHCDAVELADLFGAPLPRSRAEHAAWLRGLQDPVTGLVPELGGGPGRQAAPADPAPPFPDHTRAYHVLCVGYALDLLGSAFAHPVPLPVAEAGIAGALDRLPWGTNAWGAGAVVDALGTALTWAGAGRPAGAPPADGPPDGARPDGARPDGARPGVVGLDGARLDGVRSGGVGPGPAREAMIRRLRATRDPGTGLWGSCADGLREPVNGTYRLVRGTFAAWGLRAGPDDALVDTVLRRGEEVTGVTTACDVLDVAYLLWWAAPEARRRRVDDVRAVVRRLVDRALATWVPGEGAPFATDGAPSLQGTEMWSATLWYLADLLGHADALGYRPRGIHRPV